MRTIFRRSIVQSDAIIVIIPATKADLPSPRCSSSTVKSMSSSHAAPQSGEVTKVAKSKGFVTIAEDGVRRVVQGVTSLDEVSRVIDLTDRLG